MRIRMHVCAWIGMAAALAVTATAFGRESAAETAGEIDPAAFHASITNPLFPISLTGPRVFAGAETDPDTGDIIETRLESRILDRTEMLLGVTLVVLEEKAYQDGELVERALDYFAQHDDGTVYYFGELVDNYENGRLKDHHGQWLAGEGDNAPGVLMPATPVIGVTYRNEHAPGIAEDEATVLSLGERVVTPAGAWDGCMKTRDSTPLEPGIEEFKYYCPGIGLVREESADGVSELTSYGPPPATATPAATATAAGQPLATPSSATSGVGAPNAGVGYERRGGGASAIVVTLLAAGAIVAVAGAALRARASALRRR